MKRTVKDVDVKGKRVLLRADLNEPVVSGRLGDDFRLRALLPTVNYLIGKKARVIILAHLGRPEGRDMRYTLRVVAERLAELLGKPVQFVPDTIGYQVDNAVGVLGEGEILLLENVRFYSEEEKNDPGFAQRLASYGEVYVNDAFADSHRAHASIVGVPKFLPSVAGLLMANEIRMLDKARTRPKDPLVFIIGGAKVQDKIKLLDHYLSRAQTFIIGGAMANTFLAAGGRKLGRSIYEPRMLSYAKKLMNQLEKKGVNLVLPVDGVAAGELSQASAGRNISSVDELNSNELLADIGPKTLALAGKPIASAASIIWNGPMGAAEYPAYAGGTERMAKLVAGSAAESFIGGGDTAGVINKLGIAGNFTFVSTGGGAALKYLAGESLPGIEVIEERYRNDK